MCVLARPRSSQPDRGLRECISRDNDRWSEDIELNAASVGAASVKAVVIRTGKCMSEGQRSLNKAGSDEAAPCSVHYRLNLGIESLFLRRS